MAEVEADRADKDPGRLDGKLRQRVLDALQRLATDPDAGIGLRKLSGRAEHRLRVGERRVILELDHASRKITVNRVLPRGRAYRR
jgi:mRNA-degrading endonuclease RelE of RelBE toxin-antitoxin system